MKMELDIFQADYCAEQLKALGEPVRLRILALLKRGEMNVSEIASALETEVVTVSHHLQILRNAGLVTRRKQGRFCLYGLREGLLQEGLDSAQVVNLGCCAVRLPGAQA